jgi:glutathione S-transferase
MKLYYVPGACSLSPHIVLREAGVKFDLVKVDLASHRTEGGSDYMKTNPRGYVPALELDDGSVLTEGPAIVQYIADQYPRANLAPAPTDRRRYDLQSWLNFISTELHKQFSPLFNPATVEAQRAASIDTLKRRFTYVAQELGSRDYIAGDHFSVADAYLFTVIGWASYVKFDLSAWPAILGYLGRIGGRSSVQQALRAEGLIA